jgi:prepilin-type N-terminal cleavage/methylation domain-containing protein
MKVAKLNFNRAFTLLEIMVAMTLFAIVLVAVYSTWAAIVRGAKSGQEAAEAAQHSRIAMRTLEDAFLTTQLYTENIRHYGFIADTTDPKFAWLSLTARLPATFPGSGLFGDQVVRRVTFSVEPDAERIPQLVMSQVPILLITNSDITAYSITLVRDVSLFVVEFWDTRLGDWTDEWLTTNQLPKMLRVSIGIGHAANSPSKPSEITSRIIALPSIAVTPDIQQPVVQP